MPGFANACIKSGQKVPKISGGTAAHINSSTKVTKTSGSTKIVKINGRCH